jgi:hypothetical protein
MQISQIIGAALQRLRSVRAGEALPANARRGA